MVRKGTKPKKPNNLLRMERKNKGWSQARLAELIGADTSMISRWECGERSPEPAYQEKLCTLFDRKASELGFIEDAPTSRSPVDSSTYALTPREYAKFAYSFPSISPASNTELLKGIIDRNFSKEILYDLLSLNIKTMNFREEWQYVVNNLVAEAQIGLRAMVFDTELTRWWNTLAGQMYMMTNMELVKRKVPVKRIFILSSIDARLRLWRELFCLNSNSVGIITTSSEDWIDYRASKNDVSLIKKRHLLLDDRCFIFDILYLST